MPLYIQHGHGKSDKITRALSDAVVTGVILAARNESRANLESCMGELNGRCEVLLDPQFYLCTLVPANDKYLPEDYSAYYQAGRTASDFIRGSAIRGYAKGTIDLQVEVGVNRIISPSVIFDSFNDRWSQIALTLADASLEYHAGIPRVPPLLLTFVFDEGALASKNELDLFLDTVTAWDAHGFHLIVVRQDPSYSQRFDDTKLANLLYLVHVLGARNDYQVVCGYSDFVGPLLRAAGAHVVATGWYHSLRAFHRKTFLQRRPGGQPPRERYSSAPLMNSILLGELQSVFDVGKLDQVLSGVAMDRVITAARSPADASAWNRTLSEVHHWQTLKTLEDRVTGNPRSDVPTILSSLETASGLYTELARAGVIFDRLTGGTHLQEWIAALRQFRQLARI